MALTNSSSRGSRERRLGGSKALFGVSFENTSCCAVPPALTQDQGTTLDKLSVGQRVCDRPQTGEIVRVMPMTGRVVVRLDPLTQSGAAPSAACARFSSRFARSSRWPGSVNLRSLTRHSAACARK
jgi:hypothetical protein